MTKEEALSKKLEELGIPRDIISNLSLKGLIFNAERRFNRYEMYEPGDTFEGRLLRWLSNFSPEDRCVAINLVKYIQYISRNELRALVEFVLDLASTLSWHSVIQSYTSKSEVSWNDAFDREIKRNIFVAVSDDIGFDYFRRQGRRRFPQLEKENFVEYYKMGETDIKDIEANVGSLKRFFLLDQFCGSGTSALRFEGREHESKGKLRGFFNRWRPVIANADVYYVPLIASSFVKSVLQEKLRALKVTNGLVFTSDPDSELSRRAGDSGWQVFLVSKYREGFVSTVGYLATLSSLLSVFAPDSLKEDLDMLFDYKTLLSIFKAADFRARGLCETLSGYPHNYHFIALGSGWARPALVDLESKLVEGGIATIECSELKNLYLYSYPLF